MGVYLAGGALSDEVAVAIAYDEGDEMALGGGGAFREVGELLDLAEAMGAAVFCDGALRALGLFGSADEGAEFHQGLVQPADG